MCNSTLDNDCNSTLYTTRYSIHFYCLNLTLDIIFYSEIHMFLRKDLRCLNLDFSEFWSSSLSMFDTEPGNKIDNLSY